MIHDYGLGHTVLGYEGPRYSGYFTTMMVVIWKA